MERVNVTESSSKQKNDYLNNLMKTESGLTEEIKNRRSQAYRSGFNILGIVLSAGILASGSVFLSIITIILFTPFSLMVSSHKFSRSDYVKAMNPLMNLMLGTSPAVKYIEMINLRNTNRKEIKSYVNTLGKISRETILEMLSMVESNQVKLVLFEHYKKNI